MVRHRLVADGGAARRLPRRPFLSRGGSWGVDRHRSIPAHYGNAHSGRMVMADRVVHHLERAVQRRGELFRHADAWEGQRGRVFRAVPHGLRGVVRLGRPRLGGEGDVDQHRGHHLPDLSHLPDGQRRKGYERNRQQMEPQMPCVEHHSVAGRRLGATVSHAGRQIPRDGSSVSDEGRTAADDVCDLLRHQRIDLPREGEAEHESPAEDGAVVVGCRRDLLRMPFRGAASHE